MEEEGNDGGGGGGWRRMGEGSDGGGCRGELYRSEEHSLFVLYTDDGLVIKCLEMRGFSYVIRCFTCLAATICCTYLIQ